MDSPTNLLGTVLSVADLITNKGQITPPLVPAPVHPGLKHTPSYHHILKSPSTFTLVTTVTYLSQVPGAGDMTLTKVIANVLTQTHSLLAPLPPPSVTAKVTHVVPVIGNTVVTAAETLSSEHQLVCSSSPLCCCRVVPDRLTLCAP